MIAVRKSPFSLIRWFSVYCAEQKYKTVGDPHTGGNMKYSRQRLISAISGELIESLSYPPLAERLVKIKNESEKNESEIKAEVLIPKVVGFIELAKGLSEGRDFVVDCMLAAIRDFDKLTYEHSLRVSHLANHLAIELKMSKGDLDDLRIAAEIHDLGKIGIPLDLLNSPRRWTDNEDKMKPMHLLIVLAITEQIPSLRKVAGIVRYNHYYNGYPEGIKNEEVPLTGQIISAADCFDALTYPRPYRQGEDWSVKEALAEVEERGKSTDVRTPYDPLIISNLEKIVLSPDYPF